MVDSATLTPLLDAPVQIPAYVRDLDSFRTWVHSEEFPRDLRISYIRGEMFIELNAQEINTHALLKGHLYSRLAMVVEQNESGHLLPDPTLFVNEDADVSNEPDLIFVSWDSLRSGRVEYRERKEGSHRLIEVVGSPDMVAEVVSDSSVTKDTQHLLEAYYAAGVDEYWVVDARGEEVEFQIHIRGDDAFEAASADAEGYFPSPVFGRAFRLDRELDPVGMYRYRLESRAT